MKEDKLDQEIAASLKKKLAEATVPYELGAWEGFQKKRALRKRNAIVYWASGIAASLLLIAVGMNDVDFSGNDTVDSTEVQFAESTGQSPVNGMEEFSTKDTESIAENLPLDEVVEPESESSNLAPKSFTEAATDQKPQLASNESKALASVPQKIIDETVKNSEVETVPESIAIVNDKTVVQVEEKLILEQTQLLPKTEEVTEKGTVITPEETLALAKAEEPVKPVEEKKFVAESEFPVIPKDKTSVGLGMGVSPGFGAVQSDNQVATAQTIGLGMLVDINLPGKFTLGSGLALNYLSQNAEQESMVLAFGNSYPQTEKLEVRQMQVELPVFVKYPLTRNNSISVQAGFSNFYALNQTANQENTVERQSAFYANDALGSSSVSFRQESVTEFTSLESKDGKFYPFATVNLGLNFRVLETKGANYVIMPFYNYQLKQVSGYGDTYGLFGASFKMNFGGK